MVDRSIVLIPNLRTSLEQRNEVFNSTGNQETIRSSRVSMHTVCRLLSMSTVPFWWRVSFDPDERDLGSPQLHSLTPNAFKTILMIFIQKKSQ
jgi:hypothetical protein